MIDQAILVAALEGLQLQRARLDEQIAQVQGMITGKEQPGRKPKKLAAIEEAATPAKKKKRKKRVLSPEARERIAAAQKKRWAAARAEKA